MYGTQIHKHWFCVRSQADWIESQPAFHSSLSRSTIAPMDDSPATTGRKMADAPSAAVALMPRTIFSPAGY